MAKKLLRTFGIKKNSTAEEVDYFFVSFKKPGQWSNSVTE